ncbi:type II toxin-antitoxin system VapC family toxin [Chelativorans xinjiangense]|uniref:type II toxin-antitoxin system VapC family toxin n=1 Tax=Chelativorans xinjiangense TaxID=2681485 RepID=UPI00135A50BC|nr:type II toxin-antitoxin system VapC family toxin [Chelativorans xinjiangense]
MFLDASAVIAILGDEADAEHLTAKIDAAQEGFFYSPLSTYEAVIGLTRKMMVSARRPIKPQLIERAEEIVENFFSSIGAMEIAITSEITREAIAATKRYGRGSGHPAKLNLGDCFAYACARSTRVPLLFKGNDFSHTDIDQV